MHHPWPQNTEGACSGREGRWLSGQTRHPAPGSHRNAPLRFGSVCAAAVSKHATRHLMVSCRPGRATLTRPGDTGCQPNTEAASDGSPASPKVRVRPARTPAAQREQRPGLHGCMAGLTGLHGPHRHRRCVQGALWRVAPRTPYRHPLRPPPREVTLEHSSRVWCWETRLPVEGCRQESWPPVSARVAGPLSRSRSRNSGPVHGAVCSASIWKCSEVLNGRAYGDRQPHSSSGDKLTWHSVTLHSGDTPPPALLAPSHPTATRTAPPYHRQRSRPDQPAQGDLDCVGLYL